ncbi:MAG: Hsp20/alpha crystallin family protein [Pseudomonadota bacterium]
MADQEITVAEKPEVDPSAGEFTREGVYFTPAVDIYETEKELVMLVDMPGVEGSTVEVDLKDDVLSLIGRVPGDDVGGEDLLTEYRSGNYFRTFRLTEVVDQAGISAAMKDGVLTLTLPKAQKAVPRKIPISGD